MFKLDSTLPNIEDVEDLLSAVRFEQPAAQRLMDAKIIDIVIHRAQMTLDTIG